MLTPSERDPTQRSVTRHSERAAEFPKVDSLHERVFQLAIQQQQWTLLSVGLIGAGAGFYYYLKIAASMFLGGESEDEAAPAIPVALLSRIVMILLIAVILIGGINPSLILGFLG